MLFSGITVVVALMGLLIVPQTIFRSLSGGAILVVSSRSLASLTLLPAILSLLATRFKPPSRCRPVPASDVRSDLKPLTRVRTAVVSLVFFWFFVFVAVARGVQIWHNRLPRVCGKPATPTEPNEPCRRRQ